MTYNELYEQIYGGGWNEAQWAELGEDTRTAWEVICALNRRKGFEAWWQGDLPAEFRDDIFEKIRESIHKSRTELETKRELTSATAVSTSGKLNVPSFNMGELSGKTKE